MLTRLRRCSEHPPIWARVGLDLTAKRVGPYNRLADFVCFPTENPSQNGRYHQRQNTDQSSGMPHSGIPPSTGAGGERNGPVRRVRSVGSSKSSREILGRARTRRKPAPEGSGRRPVTSFGVVVERKWIRPGHPNRFRRPSRRARLKGARDAARRVLSGRPSTDPEVHSLQRRRRRRRRGTTIVGVQDDRHRSRGGHDGRSRSCVRRNGRVNRRRSVIRQTA